MSRTFANRTWFVALFWAVIVFASLFLTVASERAQTTARAQALARLAFSKDRSFRLWSTRHGGVYVPVTTETSPNPYLDVPEKEAATGSGRRLTLMNPAYMMRQLYEMIEADDAVRGHITSLNPLRPENGPDPWERGALERFAKGEKAAFSIQTLDGREYARFMEPFVTTKGCLKCHAKQGYKEGDIRGGISVAVPMAALRAFERRHMKTAVAGHLAVWLAGLLGIAIYGRSLARNDLARAQAEAHLRAAEEKMSKAFHASPEWITITTVSDGRYMEVNSAFERETGYSRDEAVGKTSIELGLWEDPGDRSAFVRLFQREGSVKNSEIRLKMRSGDVRTMLWSAQPITIGGEECMLNLVVDITEKKQTEEALTRSEERLRAFVRHSHEGIWCIEMADPIPTSLSTDEQVQRLYEQGYLIECSDSMARMHGFGSAEEMLGARFGSLMPRLSRQNVENLRTFIRSGYGLTDQESQELDASGSVRWFLNNLMGMVESGRLVRVWGVQQDITERKNLEERLQILSITDPLTGLHNRRGFMNLAEQQVKAARRTGQGFTIAFVDVDHMKDINDRLGHEEGDRALKAAAGLLRETFRESDIVARIGGDEFAVLAPGGEEGRAQVLAGRLEEGIGAFNRQSGERFRLSLSMGTAFFEPVRPCTLDEVMARADALMYEEKQNRREREEQVVR